MSWLGRRAPRRSVGGNENPLREAMRSRGGISIKPPAPTDVEDNEADPEKSSLDWLNLNAFGSKAIQGAIDRVRASTLGGAAEPEAKQDGLLMSPRKSAPEGRSESYPSGRKSLGNALRTRGGISRAAPGSDRRPELDELEEPQVTHVETAPAAPVLDRSTTDPLPAVQEEDREEHYSPLMTPKASEQSQPLVEVDEEREEENVEMEKEEAKKEESDKDAEKEDEDTGEDAEESTGEGLEQVEASPCVDETDEPEHRSAEPSNVSEDALKIIAEEEESEKKAIEAVQRKGSDDSQDSTRHVKPQKDSEKTTRLPMPTPLMAATASAKRAEPPPMVVKTEKISQEPPAPPLHQLPAPDAYLSVHTPEVGRLKELREFWGNKTSKGFAGPGLAGSRLSKNEAQATLQRLLIAGGDFDEVRRLRKIIAELEAT
ncbi:unnamed protein product [Durusdinium trenchii]|uniref:Dual-specificity RNA methyltransferase RlmN n=2 Tax=Durusdinium trenchii TaxID=1381693 RepID=A0ABP0KF27_9DINO